MNGNLHSYIPRLLEEAIIAKPVLKMVHRSSKIFFDELGLMERGRKRLAFEFKASTAPQLTRGCATMLRDIAPDHSWVVCPVVKGWELFDGVTVASIDEVLAAIM